MAAAAPYNVFSQDLADGKHDFNSPSSVRIALSNTLPVATQTNVSAASEIATGGGYTQGTGYPCTVVRDPNSSGRTRIKITAPTEITAVGGAIPQFQYVIFCKPSSGELMNVYDVGSPVDLADGQKLDLAYDAVNGWIEINQV
jgi:hypothetical protein